MKKILVLGGTNFFGKKAVQKLVDKGYDVTIATRGNKPNPFEGKAQHIILDARDQNHAGWDKVVGQVWDAVFDNICYTAEDARIIIEKFNHQIEHFYFTSSMAVYSGEIDGYTEADFDPRTYQIDPEKEVNYGEGKRQVEQVLFTEAPFKVTAFRFPIVLDLDDYTKRLHFYVEKALNNEEIQFNSPDVKVNYVKGTTAADSIVWAIENQQVGIFNISSRNAITISTFISWLEEMTGKSVDVTYTNSLSVDSPFSTKHDQYLISDKIAGAGFELNVLEDWLKPLIQSIAEEIIVE